MKKYLILFACAAAEYCVGQPTFQKLYGGPMTDYGQSVRQTTDGGYIIAGRTNSYGAGNYDMLLIKTDAAGDTLWTRTFGGANVEIGTMAEQTSDGGYIIVGHSNSFGVGGPTYDAYLVKTDSNGNLQWSKYYSGFSFATEDIGVQELTGGGFIIYYQGILLKTDSNGNVLWTKGYNVGESVKQTNDGGFILAGGRYLIKTDSAGSIAWGKLYNDSLTSGYYRGITQTTDGGYAITGYATNNGYIYLYFVKTDSVGTLSWLKLFRESPSGSSCSGKSVQQTSDGGYIISGGLYNGWSDDILLMRFDNNGNSTWVTRIGSQYGDEFGYSACQTNDGGFAIISFSYGFGANTGDVYLVKENSAGNSGCNENNQPVMILTPATATLAFNATSSNFNLTANTAGTITGSGIADTLLCSSFTTEIKEPVENTFSLFPNPAVNEIKVQQVKCSAESVEIYDALGEKVFSQAITSGQTINISSLTPGIYFVKVIEGEKVLVKKMVVQR